MTAGGDAPARGVLLALAGIIGAGKSTLLELLRVALGPAGAVFPEELPGCPLLTAFYADHVRYAAALQFYALAQRVRVMHRARAVVAAGKTAVIDQYLLGDYAFAATNIADGNIGAAAAAEYIALLHDAMALLGVADAVVFLDAPVARCQANIAERGRADEDGIPDAYLADLRANMRAGRAILPFVEPHARWIELDWAAFGTAEQVLAAVAAAVETTPAPAPRALATDAQVHELVARIMDASARYTPAE
jgi:hypothetical protein